MKRLRHPINSIREPFGTAGLIVAMIALVAALGGTAFAAAKLNSTQKKEVEKIAKKFAGKPGAAGPAGATGPAGAAGAKGDTGAAGSNGTNGTNGVSVTSEEFGTSGKDGKCVGKGGSKFIASSGNTYACNGTTGFTETLPEGKTEKGSWAAAGTPVELPSFFGFKGLYAPISFNIPLATAPEAIVIGIKEGAGEENESAAITSGECTGTVAAPGAAKGKLCVFVQEARTANLGLAFPVDPGAGGPGAGVEGSFLLLKAENQAEPLLAAVGSWAVTAE